MTACDATLVIVQEDGGAYTASLALSPLMVVCVFEEVRCPLPMARPANAACV